MVDWLCPWVPTRRSTNGSLSSPKSVSSTVASNSSKTWLGRRQREHTRTHTHARTHTRTHTRTHAHARTHAHTHAHARAHTHTHTQLYDFGRQQNAGQHPQLRQRKCKTATHVSRHNACFERNSLRKSLLDKGGCIADPKSGRHVKLCTRTAAWSRMTKTKQEDKQRGSETDSATQGRACAHAFTHLCEQRERVSDTHQNSRWSCRTCRRLCSAPV